MLNVEVKGISFQNKGAELMLHAIQEEFAKRQVDARFVVEPIGDYQRRCNFGLWQKTRYIKRKINCLFPFSLLPSFMRKMLGFINENEIDVVLDASGFSYGEQWSPLVAKYRLASTISGMKNRGTKVIVMPQALGPFESTAQKKYFGHILNTADKVFARDDNSFAYASTLLKASTKQGTLAQCGDFTNIISGLADDNFDPNMHKICFIPNSKMLEMRTDGEAYIEFVIALIENVIDSSPFILIHEADADRRLAETIQQRLSRRIPVLDPQHALKIKWIIGQSNVVVSARFHGLVSALSQGVPVVATGWSHKYKELLNDYEMGEWLFDVASETERALTKTNLLLTQASTYNQVVEVIQSNAAKHKQRVKAAWDEIFAIITAKY
ncbi:hypothetical protein GPUN_2880 [Glaciecola punicea ACAM 611]|uniref:Polysaccharide pyruvyl transferase domain-containing protein n=1 Tax=Glaciecola punicea ACAM 611 TaxID=1121923 RepID=H5TF67_9ALTE|nr:polysaccharide pyruvyl transferase family protein [Glaciecola punicea]GAB56994.1 hypothetical protein GPUN_2880 [Glaciecola punicea ACAM 611]